MHDQFAVGMGNSLAHLEKEFTALPDIQCSGFAIDIERLARNILHHEKRPAIGRRAAIQQPGNIGVIEVRENLALVTETAEDIVGVHAVTNQFNGDFLRVLIVVTSGEVHGAHASAPNFPDDAVRA